MTSEYRDDFFNGEDARDDHSDSDTTEELTWEDWSTIYNEELWDMWYEIQDYFRWSHNKESLFGHIDPDDLFYDFCYLDAPNILTDFDFEEWKDHYLNDLNMLWYRIKYYRKLFGNKSKDDFCYFVYSHYDSKKFYDYTYIL